MIIKIKKRDLNVLLIILLIIPIVYATTVTQTFMVTVTMGNRGPSIFYVNITNVTPTAGTITTISIGFNVTDLDGYADLSDASATVNVTYNGVTRQSSSCTANDYSGTNSSFYNCSITFYYFDNATGYWVINASIKDNAGNATYNSTWNLTVGSLSSVTVVNNLTFTGVNLGQEDAASTNPLMLNNTGNFDFNSVNITAYQLYGVSDSSYVIGAGNFTINTTDAVAGTGMKLQNATSLNLSEATLPHRVSLTDTRGNESIYFWLDVPASPQITVQTYNSTTAWVATVG